VILKSGESFICHFPYPYPEQFVLATLTHRNGAVNRETIGAMFNRLHNARFTQGSVHWGNILMQPGPLTNPRAKRSFKTPSFRLIDFGRGEFFDGDGDESQATDKFEDEKWRFRFYLCDML
jgi:hypothetical protein